MDIDWDPVIFFCPLLVPERWLRKREFFDAEENLRVVVDDWSDVAATNKVAKIAKLGRFILMLFVVLWGKGASTKKILN